MFDFRFEDRAALQLLALLPVVVFLVWWMTKRTRQVVQGEMATNIAKFLLRSVSQKRRKIKLILQCATLLFFILALARPQSGESRQKAKSEGLEIMLAVDVSNSMLAEDARPSRLELAKHELERFVEGLSGDKVGLVAFAGSAVLLSPMTTDKSAMKMYLESLSTSAVSTQGTDFKKAINEAAGALERGGVEGDEHRQVTKIIIIASDGEDNEKGALDEAAKVAGEGIRIFTLGFGTEAGGQIPVRDAQGNLVGYKKDRSGKVVVTTSSGDALKALAEAGKGTYQQVTFGGDAIRNLRSSIDQLERTQFDSMEINHYNEHYQSFLLAGIILALLELLLGERTPDARLWRGRFEVGPR